MKNNNSKKNKRTTDKIIHNNNNINPSINHQNNLELKNMLI
jgi:hypothetical protein